MLRSASTARCVVLAATRLAAGTRARPPAAREDGRPRGRSGNIPRMPPTQRRRSGRSTLRGLETVVPPAAGAGGRQLALLADSAGRGERRSVLPGVVHVSGWLDDRAQRGLVEEFRRWALPPAGLRHPRMPTGQLMSVQSVCLGWHWRPYVYSRTADDTDGAPVKPLPDDVAALGRAAVSSAYGAAGGYEPDAVIANLFPAGRRLGPRRGAAEP